MNSSLAKRRSVVLVYLLPLICGLILLIWAAIPHLFFVYGADVKETISVFELMESTQEQCRLMLDGQAQGSTSALYFSYAMLAAVFLSRVAILAHLIASVTSFACACVAFSYPADHSVANRAKRWMRFFCFNPGTFTISCLLCCLPFYLPLLLNGFYQNWFFYDMSLHYFGIPSWIAATVLALGSAVAFVATRHIQREEKMDLFSFYHNT